MRILLTACWVGIASASVVSGQVVDVLDLTSVQPPSSERPSGARGDSMVASITAGTASGISKPTLDLRLVNVIPSACQWNAPLVYEVEIINVGQQPVRLPWADEAAVQPRGPGAGDGFLEGYLRLVVTAPSVLPRRMGLGTILRGSNDAPATVKTLQPGERARIRARTTCAVIGNPAVRRELERLESPTVRLHAELSIGAGPGAGGPRVASDSVPLVLTR